MIFNKKKKAFAFIQSLIVLMFIVLILNISLKLIDYNYSKSKVYKSYNDKKSLTIEEELILKDINQNKNYTYNTRSYELIKKKDIYYLIKKSSNSNAYLQLEFKDRDGEKILVPTYYKTENIIGDINRD